MFFIPLVLGFSAARGFDWLFLGAASAAFLAREPFMALWRSWRRHTDPALARSATFLYVAVAAMLGAPLLLQRPMLLVFGLAGALMYVWHAEAAMRGEGRSVWTELLAIATSNIGGPAAYYAVTGRLDGRAALVWYLCALYFAGTVFYVRMRLTSARARNPEVVHRARKHCLIYHAVQAALLLLTASAAIGFLPAQGRAWRYIVRPDPQVNLKQVGWTEVAWSLFFLAFAIFAVTR